MIKLHDIQTAVVERLKSGGHTVTANDVDEGFEKPTFFIDIFQNSAAVQNAFMQLVNVGVELKYIDQEPTQETLINVADSTVALLTKAALKVQDRFLSINEVVNNVENNTLFIYFELEFMRETVSESTEYEKMKDLGMKLEIGVKANGTSAGAD